MSRMRLCERILCRGACYFWLLLSCVIVISVCPSAPAQDDAVREAKPLYPLPAYEEDWSFLRDSSRKEEPWDTIKFTPLAEGGRVYLSLGGEMRETHERFHNPDFGESPQDPSGYLLQRYLFHTDFHVGSRFRFFGELNSSVEDFRTGGPRPVIDEDKFDVHQGFLDFSLKKSSHSEVILRAGRQEIQLGSARMVALREGPNVPFSFDGFRLFVRTDVWHMDGFATRPVESNPGIFDDAPDHTFSFWGVYASRNLPRIAGATHLDVYYLGADRKRARFNQGMVSPFILSLCACMFRHKKCFH